MYIYLYSPAVGSSSLGAIVSTGRQFSETIYTGDKEPRVNPHICNNASLSLSHCAPSHSRRAYYLPSARELSSWCRACSRALYGTLAIVHRIIATKLSVMRAGRASLHIVPPLSTIQLWLGAEERGKENSANIRRSVCNGFMQVGGRSARKTAPRCVCTWSYQRDIGKGLCVVCKLYMNDACVENNHV